MKAEADKQTDRQTDSDGCMEYNQWRNWAVTTSVGVGENDSLITDYQFYHPARCHGIPSPWIHSAAAAV